MWFFRQALKNASSDELGATHDAFDDGAWPGAQDHTPTHPWARPGDDNPGFIDARTTAKRFRSRPIIRYSFMACACGVILASGWLAVMMFYYTLKFPDPFAVRRDASAPVIRILARDGSLLAERGAAHPYMPIDMLPNHVIDAVVATEDRRFFEHYGIDPLGMTRATFANMRAGRFVQGGSTLTQQLAKNLFLSHDRTITRKIDELALAVWLEYRLSKREILELYLNRVYFGAGAYGIEAAAQRYFGKSARAMNVAEAALIAGLLKAPSRYAPTNNPGAGRARGRSVLRKMRAAGLLTVTQFTNANKQTLRFVKKSASLGALQGHEYAVDYILDRLPPIVDADNAGLVVETTIDASLQRTAHKVISDQFKTNGNKLNATQAALVVMDPDGGLRTIIGGVDYAKSQYNRATNARRQPGSTFKPFVYLAALESGYRPDTITYDLPLSVGGWTPRNANGKYKGTVTVREALAKSINTVAVRLALEAGTDNVISLSRRLGIKSKLRSDPSLALGTSEIPLIELTGAYNTFASGGIAVEPHIIHRIRTAGGRVLYARSAPNEHRRIDAKHVGAMNDMLNAALLEGTGRRAAIARHPAAGKTGTSQEFRDAWFIGYTAHMTAGVWVGNDKGEPMRKVTGGGMPAEIWKAVMTKAHLEKMALPLPHTARIGTRLSAGPANYRSRPIQRQPKIATNIEPSTSRQLDIIKPTPATIPPLPSRAPKKRYPTARIPNNFVIGTTDKQGPSAEVDGQALARGRLNKMRMMSLGARLSNTPTKSP